MFFKSGQAKFDPTEEHPARRAKRHSVDSLRCNLGPVLDLSTVGMRIACQGKPPLKVGQTGQIKLVIPEGSLTVVGRAVWLQREGLRKYQLGIEFINVKRSVAAALDLLARFGFIGGGDAKSNTSWQSSGPNKAKDKRTVQASIDLPDYYRILGVKRKATPREIKLAFRSLARKYHPDVTDDPNGAERFMEVNEAYEILRDNDRRKQYDKQTAA